MTGIGILVLAFVGATAFGLYRRRVDGRFDTAPSPPAPVVEVRGALATSLETPAALIPNLTLGERATFVQFSSAFCAPCRTTRVLLADVADREAGVVHVEVDAEQHLDLVRELDVRRTPTTLILDHAGREIGRAAGAPRREQVLAALPAAVPVEVNP